MSFQNKQDYFDLEDASISCTASNDGKTAQTVEAMNEVGSIIAREVFGERCSPNCEYKIKSTVTKTIHIGDVNAFSGKKYMLGKVDIKTTAGGEPTIAASGEQVEDDAVTCCYYSVQLSGLSPKRHAQCLFNAYELSGTGCHVTAANYSVGGNIGIATKDGEAMASDVTEGKIECQLDIVQTSNTIPTIVTGTGWQITAPLAKTSPDASYTTYSCTLTKSLSKVEG